MGEGRRPVDGASNAPHGNAPHGNALQGNAQPGGAEIAALVARLADALLARGAMLGAAESCTGGLIAAACTELAGSSRWFERGFVVYSNAAKTELLGVPAALIAAHGAVSEAVARAMAEGALDRSAADYSVAVTGIAGPGGGTPAKPVGTVWLAVGERGGAISTLLLHADGDRAAVRAQALVCALERLLERLRIQPGAAAG